MKNETNSYASDGHIYQEVQRRIRWDKRISTEDIHVYVNEGVVELSGVVDEEHRKSFLAESLSQIKGVREVKEGITVRPRLSKPDRVLQKSIQKRIRGLGLFLGERVSVDVVDGFVKLDGVVRKPQTKGLCSGFVWELSGVKDCLNLVEIQDDRSSFQLSAGGRLIWPSLHKSRHKMPPLAESIG